jgi:hypothetical protein
MEIACAMQYSVECPCAQTLAVQAAQAGAMIACRCGAQVKVPILSKPRECAGQNAYEASTIDVIHGMLRRGELPAGESCAVNGDATQDVLQLYVEAERTCRAGDNRVYAWLGILVSPILLLGLFNKPRPDVGRQTVVPTPLRVAAAHHFRVQHSSLRALKRWLRGVPIYSKLLDEYPRARGRDARLTLHS